MGRGVGGGEGGGEGKGVGRGRGWGGEGGGERVVVGHCPISKLIIMNAPVVLVSFELYVWFVNKTSSINILLKSTSDYNLVVTYE